MVANVIELQMAWIRLSHFFSPFKRLSVYRIFNISRAAGRSARDVESDANCFAVTFMIIALHVSRCAADNLLHVTSVSQLYYKRDALERLMVKYVGAPFAL